MISKGAFSSNIGDSRKSLILRLHSRERTSMLPLCISSCITSYSKTLQLKAININYLVASMGQESGSGLAGGSGSACLLGGCCHCRLRLHNLELEEPLQAQSHGCWLAFISPWLLAGGLSSSPRGALQTEAHNPADCFPQSE